MEEAAEVISLGEWLDHIPLPVFSCCGWGLVVGLGEKEGGRERQRIYGIKEKGEKWEGTW